MQDPYKKTRKRAVQCYHQGTAQLLQDDLTQLSLPSLGLHKTRAVNCQSYIREKLMRPCIPYELLASSKFWRRDSHCLQLYTK